MRKSFVLRGFTSVTTLLISLSILFSATLQAEELKAFLTIKIAPPETLLNVAGKIAEIAGASKDFENAVAPFKELSGLNPDGSFGFVLHSNGDEIKEPLLILPINDLKAVNLPGFETITTGLKKQSDGKYLINSPLGNYLFYQKKGFVAVVTEESELTIPDNPKALFAELEKTTIGFKIDFENASLDAIETALALPQMFFAMQAGPQATQAIEQFNEALTYIYEKLRSETIGISFDPKTADLNLTASVVPKKDSELEKQIADYKNAKTKFSGFLGNPNEVIFSWSNVETIGSSEIDFSLTAIDQLFDAVLLQIEEQSETDEELEANTSLAESAKKIFTATIQKGKGEVGASLDANGTLLLALTIGETADLEKLGVNIFDRIKKDHNEDDVNEFLKKYLKKNDTVIEGFNVSSLKIPLEEAAEGHELPEKLAKETVGLFWAINKDDEAVAIAAGFDFDKTEKSFRQALAQTKTPVPLKQPIGVFALQPLGKLLKKYTDNSLSDTVTKSIELLSSSGTDAKITVSGKVIDGAMHADINVSGKAITVLANIIKIFAGATAENSGSLDRSKIKEF
ncbi:MAG: hypothetical protein LBP87_07245 [Planctomycetaceae bacterium]|jgi:hypothetical protein|nr:hypothetical protein [Planctomycetaceae bacterium]